MEEEEELMPWDVDEENDASESDEDWESDEDD